MVLFVCCENMSCIIKNILEVDKHTLLLSASFSAYLLFWINWLLFGLFMCMCVLEVDGVGVGGVGRLP